MALSTALVTMLVAVARLDREVRSARSSQAALISAGHLQASVLSMESAERGFVITHDPRFMATWQQARAAIPLQSVQLQMLVSEDAQQHARVQHLNDQITTYVADMSKSTVAGAAGHILVPDATQLLNSQQRLDAIHTEFAQFTTREMSEAARQAASADEDTAWAWGVAGLTLAGSLLVMAVYAALMNRGIARPVVAAAGMADELAAGALSTRMPESGPHEIGVLQRSFNAMARSLEAYRDDLQRLVAEQSALRRIATLVARASPPDTVFGAVTEEVGQLLRADVAMLLRYEPDKEAVIVAGWSEHGVPFVAGTRTALPPDGAAMHVYASQRPWWTRVGEGTTVPDPFLTRYGITVSIGAPIVMQGNLWGALIVMAASEEQLRPDDAARTADFTDLVGVAIANLQARADLTAASVRIVEASDQARRKLERDLHDGTQQRLLALLLDLRRIHALASAPPPEPADELADELADERASAQPPVLTEELAEITDELADAINDLREFSHGVHPVILTERGLESALKTLTRRSPVPTELHIHLPSRLPPNIETSAYHVVAEAITNTAKHAHATRVRIDATADEQTLQLRIEDDGVGGADPSGSSGLRGLGDRVTALGGSSRLASPPGHGTTLWFTIPLNHTPAPESVDATGR
ncbi:CHASE3 domain-containing protein [Dactylosporangium siamense]|uniref:CHASE3 domain-containing protein n=1 Tax=Dactylosporangium siamense TaxID=685454 RepID=UPI001944AC20|nr:CHASE3 domain-containing protein [Dactylosporangium siamense]